MTTEQAISLIEWGMYDALPTDDGDFPSGGDILMLLGLPVVDAPPAGVVMTTEQAISLMEWGMYDALPTDDGDFPSSGDILMLLGLPIVDAPPAGVVLGLPIIWSAEEAMGTLIQAMTVAGGYSFDWGTSNQFDGSLKDDKPTADVMLAEEDNRDEEGEAATDYTNHATVEIRVLVPLLSAQGAETAVTPGSYATQEARKRMHMATNDLKRLFGGARPLSHVGIALVQYLSFRRELSFDLTRPLEFVTRWRLEYTQDRTDPTLTGA